MKTTLKTLFLATTGVSLLTAFAATAAENDAAESIVVTAQRRAERLQDVPITIANLSAETMRQANVTQLSDITKITAGVRFDARSTFTTPSIRGISTNIAFAGGGSLVGVYVDGYYAPALQSSDMQLMNVESVQVLKGPQGTLFGRNVTGGAIMVTTSKPSQDTRAVVEAAYGSYNAQRYQGYVTTPLSDKVAVDAAAMLSKGDGWVTNIYNGNEKAGRYKNTSIRVGANFDITDRFSVLLRYSHGEKNDPSGTLQVPYTFQGAPACQICALPGALTTTKFGEVAADEPLSYVYSTDAYQLTATYDADFATLTSYTQYRKDRGLQHYSLDYTTRGGAALSILDRNITITQELLATSKPGDRLQWTAGVFYFDWKSEFAYVGVNGVQNPTSPYPFSSGSGAVNNSIAVYGDATYELTDSLFVTAGLRYNHDKFSDGYFQTANAAGVNGRNAPVLVPSLSTNVVVPRAVVRYQLNPESSIYASASKGYKGAVINVGGQSAARINPESLWAFEVGYKYAQRDFSANLSAYYYDYKDQQLQQSQFINGRPSTLITNAASSEMYGIDADFRYQVTEDLSVNFGGNYSHARYKSFRNAPGITRVIGATGLPSYPPVIVDASGFPMAKAPDWSANLGLAYTVHDVAQAGSRLVLSTNLYYTSKLYFDLSAQIPQSAYALLDLRAEWTDASDRYTLAISGKNVTDKRYWAQAGTNFAGVGAVYGAPATVEGSFRVKF